jgi:hypothetical protein
MKIATTNLNIRKNIRKAIHQGLLVITRKTGWGSVIDQKFNLKSKDVAKQM